MVEFVEKQVDELKKLLSNKRQLAFQGLNLAMIVLSALMIWKSLMVVTKSESPVVVVSLRGLEPSLRFGDMFFLDNGEEPLRAGEVVVFKMKDREIGILHRVMNVHERPDGTLSILTKGDANTVNDRGLYAQGQMWLGREDISGRVWGRLPCYVGIVAIILKDFPLLKYFLVGKMGLLVISNRRCRSFRLVSSLVVCLLMSNIIFIGRGNSSP